MGEYYGRIGFWYTGKREKKKEKQRYNRGEPLYKGNREKLSDNYIP